MAHQLLLQAQQPPVVSGLHQLMDQGGGGGEADGEALLTGGQPQAQRDMGFAGAGQRSSEAFAERLRQGFDGSTNPVTRPLLDGARFVHVPNP